MPDSSLDHCYFHEASKELQDLCYAEQADDKECKYYGRPETNW